MKTTYGLIKVREFLFYIKGLKFFNGAIQKSDKLLSEKSKMENQLEWAKLMNNYKNIAEVILKELIYV